MVNISKYKFCKALEQLKKGNEIQERIDKIMKEVPEGSDFMYGYGTAINHECLAGELLELLMNDQSGFIGWWLWEMDYGKRIGKGSVTYKNKPYDVRKPEDLYDFLVMCDEEDYDEAES